MGSITSKEDGKRGSDHTMSGAVASAQSKHNACERSYDRFIDGIEVFTTHDCFALRTALSQTKKTDH